MPLDTPGSVVGLVSVEIEMSLMILPDLRYQQPCKDTVNILCNRGNPGNLDIQGNQGNQGNLDNDNSEIYKFSYRDVLELKFQSNFHIHRQHLHRPTEATQSIFH